MIGFWRIDVWLLVSVISVPWNLVLLVWWLTERREARALEKRLWRRDLENNEMWLGFKAAREREGGE